MTDTATVPDAPVDEKLPPLSLGDWVKVVNVGDNPVVIQWDSRIYKIGVNEERFVPFEAAKLWFGDPRAAGNVRTNTDALGAVSWIPDRATEVRRLRALYDNQFGDETKIVKHPEVVVYTQDGQRVYTVLDDPTGERITPAAQTVMDHADIKATVLRQQQMIDMLMNRMNLTQDAETQQSEHAAADTETEAKVQSTPTTTESRVPMTDDDAVR